jgi:hypothetical protein
VTDEHDPLAELSITDIVVVPASHHDGEWADGGPAGDPPIQLLPDLRLMRLPTAEALEYQQACEPRHLHFMPADPGGGHRYAFIRHPAPATLQTLHNFDPDDVIHQALALSRYFVLNAHCTDVAARRIEGLRPDPLQITAVLPSNRFYAWRVLDGTRGYLTQRDAAQLGPLLATLGVALDETAERVTTGHHTPESACVASDQQHGVQRRTHRLARPEVSQ